LIKRLEKQKKKGYNKYGNVTFQKGIINMSRIFKENGFSSESVLCAQDYVRFFDSENKEFVPEKIAPIIKRAESYLTKEIPILPASVYLDYPRNGNRSRYEGIYFERRAMALNLAIAESVEKGKVKLGSTAILCGFGAGMTWGAAIVRLREGIC
jgi:hypothetical protein